MKKLEVVIAKFLVFITYIITYLFPINKNRISVVSYFNSDYGLEFTKLIELLKEDGFEIKHSLHHFNNSLMGKFRYLFSFMYQAYLFNTSSVVLLDGNNFVYANINVKKKVHTMQLWHATGAIKNFGVNSTRRYNIKGYDSLIVGAEYFKSIFAEALNTKLENVHALGICKTDYLFDREYLKQKRNKFYERYPELVNKKIILYAPTFRGEGIEDINYSSDIEKLDTMLDDSYQLILKVHPLVRKKVKDNLLDLSEEDLYMLLEVAEYVISDYSALIFDAAILKKKTILYLYDLKEYIEQRGLCVDLDELNLKKGYTIEEIYDIITICGEDEEFTFLNEKFLSAIDGKSTIKVFEHIKKL